MYRLTFCSGDGQLKVAAPLFLTVAVFLLLFASVGASAQTLAPWVGSSLDGDRCYGKRQGVGPFDYLYRSALQKELNVVEGYHFTSDVESLRKGKSGKIELDIDYTLRAFPNHHRALNAMIRYQQKIGRREVLRLRSIEIPPAECYLQRAVNFSPTDATTHMLYAMHLRNLGEKQQARGMYETAHKLAPKDLQIQYNFALLLVDLDELDTAQELADTIYGQGYPLPGLKRKLEAARGG